MSTRQRILELFIQVVIVYSIVMHFIEIEFPDSLHSTAGFLFWSEVVVANMDGPDPDSGTCWECGYAFHKKAIVLYRTDFRQAGDAANAPFNLMMSESADALIVAPLASVQKLAVKVCEALRTLPTPSH